MPTKRADVASFDWRMSEKATPEERVAKIKEYLEWGKTHPRDPKVSETKPRCQVARSIGGTTPFFGKRVLPSRTARGCSRTRPPDRQDRID